MHMHQEMISMVDDFELMIAYYYYWNCYVSSYSTCTRVGARVLCIRTYVVHCAAVVRTCTTWPYTNCMQYYAYTSIAALFQQFQTCWQCCCCCCCCCHCWLIRPTRIKSCSRVLSKYLPVYIAAGGCSTFTGIREHERVMQEFGITSNGKKTEEREKQNREKERETMVAT